MAKAENINQQKLRQAIVDAFNESELKTLCFDLEIDYEALPPGSKLDKARELVARCIREKRVAELLSLCEAYRPKISWQTFRETAVSSETPPFMGLKYFDVDSADLFFGREALTEELAAHLQQNNFLAVVGASGSGKSSLVRAGLVPALQKNGGSVTAHVFTPTHHPLETAATILTRSSASIEVTAKFMDAMARDRRSLHLAARRLVEGNQRLLLVIDQFEELFTLCRSETERQAFIDNLVTAVAPDTNGPTSAVIALRADFYHHCAQYDELRRLLENQQRFIGAMNQTELRRAIEEPAKRSGLEYEPGLVDLLMRDVGAGGEQPPEPGALPLLSHALLETWRRRDGQLLTFSGYSDAGGVQGAIAKTAESVFQERLTPAQQTIARSIFLRLTELGEGTQDTRRRALISELLPADDAAEETQAVLNLLSEARLVTTDEESAEVAHEALIREWPTLRLWLSRNREGLRLHRHLTESANEWAQLNRDPGELYRGARLEQAQEWIAQHETELNELEREFLTASQAAKQQAIDEAQARQARELEQAQKLAEEEAQRAQAEARAAQRARYFNFALIVILLLVVGTAASLIFLQNAQQGREEVAQEATRASVEARETALAADEIALELASESTAAALEAATVNAQATQDIASNETRTADSAASATAVALNADSDGDGLSLAEETAAGTDPAQADTDGDQLADGIEIVIGTDPLKTDSDGDGRLDNVDLEPLRPFIQEDNLDRLQQIATLFDNMNDPFSPVKMAISPDNRYIAAGRFDGTESTVPATLYLWNLSQEELVEPPQGTSAFNTVQAIGFNGNFQQILMVTGGGTARWYFDEPEQTLTILNNPSSTNQESRCSAAFSPDAATVLFGERARWRYYLIEEESIDQIESDSQNYNTNACYTNALFTYDGTYFGMIEDEGQNESVFVGEVIDRSFGRPFNKSVSGTIDLALSPDANLFVLGFENGRVELFDYSERRGGPPLIYGLDAHPSAAHAEFSPDGTLLATSSPQDGTVRLWRVEDSVSLLEIDTEASGVTSLIFSPDGHYLLLGTTNGEVIVFGLPEERP